MNPPRETEPPNKSLAKALEILDAFSTEHPERGIHELGRELGINPTTVYRVVRTLYNAGYLEQNKQTLNYALGPEVLKLANIYTYHNPLPLVARRVFESYAARFEHNFFLATLSRYEVIYLAVMDGKGPIKVAVTPGFSLPLHSNALGKLLLAYKDKAYVQEFINKNTLETFTPRTVSQPDALLAQLEQIRQQGYAVNDGEQFDEIGAVAVPLYGPNLKPVNLAVSLTYPRQFLLEGRLKLDELLELGREIADEIAQRSELSSWG